MMLGRWLAGTLAVVGLVLVMSAAEQTMALPATTSKMIAPASALAGGATDVRFHGGHFGGGHFHAFHGGGGPAFHGGFHRFHGGFHRRGFIGPRFYAYRPYYPVYVRPLYRCRLVMTAYGPRRICFHRRHHHRWWWYHHHRRWM